MAGLNEAVRDLDGSVAVDLHESEDAYLVVADVPGATEESTRIDATADALRVTARRPRKLPADGTVLRRERPETLEFELPMPPDADADEARASLARGVLEIEIPRGPVGTDIPIVEE